MSKALILQENRDFENILKVALPSVGVDYIDFCLNAEMALEMMDKVEYDYLLLFHNKTECLPVLKATDKLSDSYTIALMNAEQEHFEHNAITFRFKTEVLQNDIEKILQKIVKASERKKKRISNYIPIDIELFYFIQNYISDVYIKISEDKFLKIFKEGDEIEDAVITRYQSKDCEQLFIHQDYYPKYVKFFLEKLEEQQVDDQENDYSILIKSQEYVKKIVNQIGLDSDVVEIVNHELESIIKSFDTSGPIWNKLEALYNSSQYMSEHSILLSHLTCNMATKLGLDGAQTRNKFIIASLFHDIELKDDSLVFVGDIETIKSAYGKEKYQEYIDHPTNATICLESLIGVSNDVYTIITQHHERPDGSGFPRGLRSSQIHLLSAIFITAEYFIDQITRYGAGPKEVIRILEVMSELFTEDRFEMAYQALIGSLEDQIEFKNEDEVA